MVMRPTTTAPGQQRAGTLRPRLGAAGFDVSARAAMTNLTTDRGGLLAALLGPGEPELTCKQCFEQLDCYVDLQLTDVDADAAVPGMRAHLLGCPPCSDDHESLCELVMRDDAQAHQRHAADDPCEKAFRRPR